jgi:hypothetical protein
MPTERHNTNSRVLNSVPRTGLFSYPGIRLGALAWAPGSVNDATLAIVQCEFAKPFDRISPEGFDQQNR